MPTKPTDTSARLTALEDAVRIMATTLYAPNGGGVDHVAEAAAFYASQCGDDAPVEAAPVDPAPEPAPEPVAETPAADATPAPAQDPAQ